MLRASAVAVVFATLGVAGVLSATALRERAARNGTPVSARIIVDASRPGAPVEQSTSDSSMAGPVEQQGKAHSVAASATGAAAAHAMLTPVIPQGETQIGDGVTATRVDSVVTLAFDTPVSRTRIPEKFEPFLRSTLAKVYGLGVDSALASVPRGTLARTQASLLYELPTRGIHIPLKDARQLAVFPEIRPGQDGPLVIRYRVSVVTPN